jgi:excisionase family DNA binding protein
MTEAILLSRRQAAELLGLSLRSIDYLSASGRLATLKIGKRRLFRREVIERFARTNHAEPIQISADTGIQR